MVTSKIYDGQLRGGNDRNIFPSFNSTNILGDK
jgi:hypothetical protein